MCFCGGFHNAIFKVAGHETIWEIIANSRSHYNRVLTLDLQRPGALEKSYKEHIQIIQLIEGGDIDQLQMLLENHHDYTLNTDERETVIRELFPQYFEYE